MSVQVSKQTACHVTPSASAPFRDVGFSQRSPSGGWRAVGVVPIRRSSIGYAVTVRFADVWGKAAGLVDRWNRGFEIGLGL
jgi:hypothetical protein